MFQDKTLTCRECGRTFLFTASEQQFYAERGFQNEPGRCPECRASRKATRSNPRGDRQMYEAVCANCGKPAMVPFQPSGDRPVFCSDCFASMRANSNRY